MKYSKQPALFSEPFEDFLDVFGNLDFLGFNNLTKFGNYLLERLVERNWNSRVFMCQYARDPTEMAHHNCDLFQFSLTNGGLGYTFNQADFWDQYSSTWYMKDFAKIYRPKGCQKFDSDDDLNWINDWKNSTNNIFYPVQSGPKNGLKVNNNYLPVINLHHI